MQNQIQTASDMLNCPSITEDVRGTLYSLWDSAFDALDEEKEEQANTILLELQAVWAKHSTYTN
jgi:hypothetical protein